ncbi:ABC transporter substrate-binding protein [Actinoplanes sp. NBRC 101535]|uniref:ABC transporter substrate-binding protein n=1 Tax=Actinoplanes sp. NBRC 101535 TaxID=3032196 RepID=UPI0024A4AE5C|nr:ABC transporter substrate-binding protein [Actinoplanes sp. NBRC 101535]GLY05603.1 ABC transporter [Actinoplanes sp. NBRC 101535]
MASRLTMAAAVAAALTLGVAGCSSPSSNNSADKNEDTGTISTQTAAIDATAKGPAPEVAGAKKGGVLTVYSQSTPNTIDPTDIYYTDSNEISKLLFRTATQFAIRDGKPVLVPDLTDVGTVSADKLTWTFKFVTGQKYEDGSEIKIEDLSYAIKRSFAKDLYANGPAYQLAYFKDGDTYKGPYAGGDTYAGVETQGADTLVIHLAKAFPDLPFYMSFPMFTPIPKAKDTKADYKNKPISTGPYKIESYTPGTQLKLVKNENWDAATDPVRHQYVDGWDFKWAGDDVKTQQQVLNSNGPDANAINYADVDASLIPQLTGEKSSQFVQGESPCTYTWQLDSTQIPLEVRKAIAKAWPYDQTWKAAGVNDYIGEAASTFMPPSVPGYQKYTPVEDLTGLGNGDPAAAKKLLEAAGKVGFEVSWYYDNTKPIPQQVSQVRADALTAAGFTVKAIGVPTAELRTKISDYDAPVNIAQGPRGWCSDWPSGGSWIPVLFKSSAVADGTSMGELKDPALDAKIDAVANLAVEESTSKWAALDEEIMKQYVAIPFYYTKFGIVIGTNVGGTQADPTMGMPLFTDMFLKG